MVKQRISITKATDERPSEVEVWDRRRALLQYSYDSQGFLTALEVTGGKLPIASLIPMLNREWISQINLIKLIEEIELIDRITLIDTISAITNIANINSVDLIDRITLLDRITLIDTITNIGTLANLTNVGTINLINTLTSVGTIKDITNIASLDLVDLITRIALIDRITLLDRITLIDAITNIGTLANLTNVGTINLINTLTTLGTVNQITNIANLQSLDLVDRITLIDAITNIGTIANITNVGTIASVTAANVQTTGGTNIVLDKLTQGAYTERRSTISNEDASPNWGSTIGVNRRSKYFPRGCRGFINTVDIYCRDAAAAGGTITVYLTPQIGMGAVASATITVPAAGAEAWRSATFNRTWSYDSLFIFVVCSNADTQYSYDFVAPQDNYTSGDSGVTWAHQDTRLRLRVIYKGQTVSDVPVSGTINNIEIPNIAGIRRSGALTIVQQTENLDTLQAGAGRLLYAAFYAGSANDRDDLIPRLYCDGVNVLPFDNTMATQQTLFITATSPGVTLGVWDTTNHYYTIIVTSPFPFKRSLQLGFFNDDLAANRSGFVYYVYEKIS